MTAKWKFREFPKLLFDTTNDKLRDLFVESFMFVMKIFIKKPALFSFLFPVVFLPAQSIIISPL
jgi:hypothetical protein